MNKWLSKLKDFRGKARIIERIRSAERGNFGDCKSVGQGVTEMRIHFGSGYRVYFTRVGNVVYVLLCVRALYILLSVLYVTFPFIWPCIGCC